MVFLCNPNNPTGTVVFKEDFENFLKKIPPDVIVVVDEAYVDFNPGSSLLPEVPQQKNLVVLQTLSKAWGLAGIRLGMAFGHPDLIGYLSRIKYPYNVNALSLDAALAALEASKEQETMTALILEERSRLAAALTKLSFVEKVHPSDANFLLIRVADPTGLYAWLMEEGIIVRDRSSVPLCGGCLRITVGSPDENDQIIEVLNHYKAP